MNAKRGAANIATNFLYQIITILMGILIPRLILVNLGSEANGLITTTNQMLTYLGLLEAGVSTAALQALFKRVAENDRKAINEVLSATHIFYRRTGLLYLLCIILAAVIFPFTVDSEIGRFNIALVVLFTGLPSVLNFWFQGKFRILLQAEGKSYILTNLSTVVYLLTSISKIVLLQCGFNVVSLQIAHFVISVLQMLFIMIYIKRHYKWIDLKEKPDFEAISKTKNLIIHQVSGLIFNNTDILILTWICGLSTASVYSMYSMLFSMVGAVVTNFNGANFILGQTYHSDFPRFLKLLDVYETFNMSLTFSLFCVANLFILPFLALYTEGVSDIEYVDAYLPYLFISVQLLNNGRVASNYAINVAEHFKETQWRSVAESVINVVVSLLAVWKLGIYGVLIGTIAALLYRTNDITIYASKRILHRSPWITYRRWLLSLCLFIVCTFAGKRILASVRLDTYLRIILWAFISCIVILPVFFVSMYLFERKTFRFIRENLTALLHIAKK